MSGIAKFVKREFLDIIPIFIYFLFSSWLLFFTNNITLEHYGIHQSFFVRTLIDSFIFTKAIIIIDKFKFINIFKNKPLIYKTVWTTLIYLTFAIILQYIEEILVFMFHRQSFIESNQNLWDSIVWLRFWLTVTWGTILLFIFCSARETIRYIGVEKFRRIFFG